MRLNYYIAIISVVAFEESLAALQLSATQHSSALTQDTSLAQMWNPVTSAINYLAPKRTSTLAGTKAKIGDGTDPQHGPITKEEHDLGQDKIQAEKAKAEEVELQNKKQAADEEMNKAQEKIDAGDDQEHQDLRKILDSNGDGKLQDSELGVLFSKVNTTGDGMLTKHQLVWLVSGLGIQVSAAYINNLWAENKDQD